MTPNKTDTTIDEIHKVRCEISERFDGDVFAIAADAARRQAASDRPVWNPTTASGADLLKGSSDIKSPLPDAAG
ncbi:hypothetical protein Pla123a_00270 [Posidoniimonas polymericola]|uniref:Uncharacterized protein n=1 Tax=Posidoniimonas polymericola TaxID=2528002 RepID=A0A5C5ZEE7_9BACT|nr:hypothetical protein [Posidoniimonas polymericola]TWT85221.1 hypothetical protein Pla123a_00270 [Posidoniimonas polymericola]